MNVRATIRVIAVWGMCCRVLTFAAEPAGTSTSSSQRFFSKSGLPTDDSFFPIAVWLQNPANAKRFQAAGINLYVGLWNGPTAEHLNQLQKAQMPVICDQNVVGLANRTNPIIAGWMHGDEPDNAQPLGNGKGYGLPIPAKNIIEDYERIRAADPTRPVLLNLGQGVAWDNWIGRGVRRNHPEDYPDYAKGCDIASFDIYPAVHDSPEVAGKLEFVARGVERLADWTRGAKPVWSCIECTHIGNPRIKATPHQVRAEVWMALIRGARGLIYFVHQFKPTFREAALLDDPEMLAAVTDINRQIRELAPVLNSPTLEKLITVESPDSASTVAVLTKARGGQVYVFAVNLHNESTTVTFALRETNLGAATEVLGESRRIPVQGGKFEDAFGPYAVHHYRLGRK